MSVVTTMTINAGFGALCARDHVPGDAVGQQVYVPIYMGGANEGDNTYFVNSYGEPRAPVPFQLVSPLPVRHEAAHASRGNPFRRRPDGDALHDYRRCHMIQTGFCCRYTLLLASVCWALCLDGFDRILSARMQGRQGPPFPQPFYDIGQALFQADAGCEQRPAAF